MSSYTKLFNSILASTIWAADDKTRIVWITMLAMADREGMVEGSIPGLANFAHVSIEDCERAVAELSAPDRYSRSQEQEGRRIEAIEGGWWIINHGKYRDTVDADERREYLRLKQRESRARRQGQRQSTDVNQVNNGQSVSPDVTDVSSSQPSAPAPAPAPKKVRGNSKACFHGAYGSNAQI